MPKPPPEILTWLQQAADAGITEPIILRHVLQRLDDLAAAQLEQADSTHFCVNALANRLEALEAAQQQPHQDKLDRLIAHDADDPTPEAAPVATDEELLAIRLSLSHGPIIDAGLVEFGRNCYNLGRQHDAAQPPAAQPAPPEPEPPAPPAVGLVEKALAKTTAILNDPGRALLTEVRETLELNLHALEWFSAPAPPPAGGLVERVVNVLGHYGDGTARAAIREVSAWIRSDLNGRSVADRLEQEADR
jgi:hypothetical protein